MNVKQIIAAVLAAMQLMFTGGVDAAAVPTIPPSVTETVSQETAAASPTSFSDVKQGQWYYKNVTEMTQSGWLFGYPDGTFRPDETISFSEFVSVVARWKKTKANGQSSHWAADRMQGALEKGWYDWDECPPTAETYDKPITRQVAVKVIMKAFLPHAQGDFNTESAKMTDFSQLDGRYYEPVLAAYSEGIVYGDKEDGRFRPKSGLSRAEACAIIARAGAKTSDEPDDPDIDVPDDGPDEESVPVSGGVSENGKLQVIGTQLCNEKGDPVVLHGMSSHGLQWYPQFASSAAIKTTASYGANLFRVAMYTGEGGYLSAPDKIKKDLINSVDAAIANDMYVIIDWHILSDGNPMDHLTESKKFFAEIAKKYKDEPAVIYEICNEPNGGITWSKNVKPYAEQVVKTIRDAGADGVILIGSPTWSQDIDKAAADPVKGDNLMYTLHFYAGTHGKELRDRIDAARKKGIAIFVSEWGTSRADGSGGVFIDESKVWLDFLDKRNISWANWSLCDKRETSAALKFGASTKGGWKESDLSDSGKFVFSRFK